MSVKSKYGYKLVGTQLMIYRDKELVAVHDTVSGETKNQEGASGHPTGITRAINAYNQAQREAKTPVAAPKSEEPREEPREEPQEAPPEKQGTVTFTEEGFRALEKSHNALVAENRRLKLLIEDERMERKRESSFAPPPNRYGDKIDESGAPVKDPNLGDLTPAYIEWARKNMTKEIFHKRYQGRI